MPHIRNLTSQELNLRIGRSIGPNETIEISDDEAAVLEGHPLMEFVDGAKKSKPAGPADTKEGD